MWEANKVNPSDRTYAKQCEVSKLADSVKQIDQEIRELTGAVSYMGNSVARLRDRLKPVLLGKPTCEAQPEKSEMMCPLAETIRNLRHDLLRINAQAEDLEREIEL